MKHLKQLLVATLASVLALLIAVPAFAASDTSISVSGLEDKDVVNYYQVIKWDSTAGKWVLNSEFAGLVNAKDEDGNLVFPEDTDPDTTRDDEVIYAIAGDADHPGEISQAEANAIAGFASGATNLGGQALSGTTTWTVNNPDAGLYMVIVAAKSPNIVYNPIFVGADYSGDNNTNSIAATASYSDTAVAKKSTTEVKKTAADSARIYQQALDSKMGEKVSFKFDTTLPVFLASYQNPTFNITDEVTQGITLDPSTITVTLDPAPASTTGVYHIENDSATGFTIVFEEDFLKSNAAPRKVTVAYDGEITNPSVLNLNYDNNTVTVEYSNGPGNEKGALKDITNHYTFSIGAQAFGKNSEKEKTYELIKVGVTGEGDKREYVVEKVLVSELDGAPEVGALKGAEFTLYESDGTTVVDTFTTDGTGVLTFTGLDEGKYVLKETKVPAGYVGDTNPHDVEIVAHYSDPIKMPATTENGIPIASYEYVVLESYDVIIDGTTTSTYKVTHNETDPTIIEKVDPEIKGTEIDNTPGVQLPSTGGIGTTIFYVVGGAMVLCGIVMFITKRRIAQIEE